ncbi:MAG TPA: hypothetical protein VI072_26345 [Polyangiaceae bacterium]
MSEHDSQCLAAFPEWLQRLPADTRAFVNVLEQEHLPEAVRARAAAALQHLVKSVDLVPQGIEELGFIETAFVLRAAAADMIRESSLSGQVGETPHGEAPAAELNGEVATLADEAGLLEGFLGPDWPRFTRYMASLDEVVVRGHSVSTVLVDAERRSELCTRIGSFAAGYRAPRFAADPKSLVKIRAFLNVKLPE